jgi:hypothetical protein
MKVIDIDRNHERIHGRQIWCRSALSSATDILAVPQAWARMNA